MADFQLPDFPDDTEPPASPVAHAVAPGGWTEDDLAAWLRQPALASWARTWIQSLRPRLGDALPRRVQQGLAGSAHLPRWLAKGSPEATWLMQYLASSDLAHAWFEEGFLDDDPAWLTRLLHLEQARVARSFLLAGNVGDYSFDPVRGYRPTVRRLVDGLIQRKDVVLTYRLSQGLACHGQDPDVRKKLPDEIQELLQETAFRSDPPLLSQVCYLFDVLRRWLTGAGARDAEGGDCLDFRNGVALVFENVHLLVPGGRADAERNFLVDNLLHWSNSPELFRSSHCLILMAETLEDVSGELRARGGKIEQVTVPRPGSARTRLKFLLPLLDAGSRMTETRVGQLPQGHGWLNHYGDGSYLSRLHRLSHDTAGLALLGIEDLLQQAAASPQRRLERSAVMDLKQERLRQESGGLLEVVEPRRSLADIGGYDALKTRLQEVIRALDQSHDPLVRSTIPMGILFAGPPGTGKSIVAEALAGESGVSMAKLGDFRGMYVGESERNLSRILALIEALHPVIVFVDEIDQAFGKRGGPSGDGGVDSRIFARLLEFMSDTDHRGQILWIGASNYPNNLDTAMKRAGRFDLVLPFLLPDRASRRSILEVILRSRLKGVRDMACHLTAADYGALAERTEGFSGAELGAIVGEALRRLAHGRLQGGTAPAITRQLFDDVLAVYRPAPGVRESYRQMEDLAVREVSFLDMLPADRRGKG